MILDAQIETELFKVTFEDGSSLEVDSMDMTTARVDACLEKWNVTDKWPTVRSVEKA